MENEEITRLLAVDIETEIVIGECSAVEVNVGDLVELTYMDRSIIGTVEKKYLCKKGSEEYNFISAVNVIYEVKNTWRHIWNVDNE